MADSSIAELFKSRILTKESTYYLTVQETPKIKQCFFKCNTKEFN